jgi:hypothetical protein
MIEIDGRPHWNVEVPGSWYGPRSVKGVGSYIGKYVKPRSGVYRLVAVGDIKSMLPMTINRVCGQDQTGTLYIGVAHNGTVRLRLQQLVRSLHETRRFRYPKEHGAGIMIGRSPQLKQMFPRECLAVDWAYPKHPKIWESNLLWHYFKCFDFIARNEIKTFAIMLSLGETIFFRMFPIHSLPTINLFVSVLKDSGRLQPMTQKMSDLIQAHWDVLNTVVQVVWPEL